MITYNKCRKFFKIKTTKSYTRYFFVCTVGRNPNGTTAFNNFDIQTIDKHPTIKECLTISDKKFPNLRDVILVSISEISSEDWELFVSEQ